MVLKYDTLLAEACGIFSGDGTLYKTNRGFVLEIRGEPTELEYYNKTVKKLFGDIFNVELKIIRRNYNGGYVIGIRKCGKVTMETFHIKLGYPIGKKSHIVEIPKFIMNSKNSKIWASYLRGEFDTDGSIYLKRSGKDRKFKQPAIQFASQSRTHLLQIKELLTRLGFNCWIEKSGKVRLCGWSTAQRFLNIVKPNNNKHWQRIGTIMPRLNAGVAQLGNAQNRF